MFGKDADCPLWKAPCKKEKCRWFTHVIGTNPNTGETINKQGCAIEFLPMLLVENAQQSRQTGASVDRLNNDVLRLNGVSATMREILAPTTPLLDS